MLIVSFVSLMFYSRQLSLSEITSFSDLIIKLLLYVFVCCEKRESFDSTLNYLLFLYFPLFRDDWLSICCRRTVVIMIEDTCMAMKWAIVASISDLALLPNVKWEPWIWEITVERLWKFGVIVLLIKCVDQVIRIVVGSRAHEWGKAAWHSGKILDRWLWY